MTPPKLATQPALAPQSPLYSDETIRRAAAEAAQVVIVNDGCAALALPIGANQLAAFADLPLELVEAVFAGRPDHSVAARTASWRAALVYQYAVLRLDAGVGSDQIVRELIAASADFPVLARISAESMAQEIEDAVDLFIDPPLYSVAAGGRRLAA